MIPEAQQSEIELTALLMLVSEIRRPLSILEIGIYEGGTLWHWIQQADRVLAIDDTMRDPGYAEWMAWASDADCELTLLEGSSHDRYIIDMAYSHGPYGFAFIDADHSYASVRLDWDNYRDMVMPGGCIALHDILPRDGYGVSQLWQEIKDSGERTQEIVADYESGWCGIGVVWM